MGRTLGANRLLAGSACGKRRRGRPLNSVVRQPLEATRMKWQRVPIVSRLVCLFFGLCGLLLAWALLSNIDQLKNQSAETWFHLAMAALGLILFLLVGIVGKIPDVADLVKRNSDSGPV